MQIKSLRIRSYRSFRIDDTSCAEAVERLGKIETYQELRSEGGSESTALRAIGWSRSAYYRWQARYRRRGTQGLVARSRRPHKVNPVRWNPSQEWAVWRMRKQYSFMGKRRLRVMLSRKGVELSESTIGRILGKGVRLGRITPCVRTYRIPYAPSRWMGGVSSAPGSRTPVKRSNSPRGPATEKPPTQRRCRTSQRPLPNRVLEPLPG